MRPVEVEPRERGVLDTIALLRDGWPALIVFVCVGLCVGILATLVQPTKYKASITGVVSPANGFLNPTNADKLPAVSDTVAKLATTTAVLRTTATTYAQAAQSPKEAAARLRVATPAWLRAHVSVATDATSSALQVSAAAPTQTGARQLAEAAGTSLANVVNEKSLAGGNSGIEVQIFPPAQNDGKVSPTPARNLLIGGDAGLILGIVAALALGIRRRRLRRPEDVATALGAPLLGFVQLTSKGTSSAELLALAEARARLQVPAGGPKGKVLLVLGTAKEDEIARVAEGIARSFAAASARALLVDADLRQRTASEMLAIGDRPGFVDTLDGADASSLIVETSKPPAVDAFDHRRRRFVGPAEGWLAPPGRQRSLPDDQQRERVLGRRSVVGASEETLASTPEVLRTSGERLSVLPAGHGVQDAASRLGREYLDQSLESLRCTWDYVIVSGPAFERMAETIALLRAADYAVFVASLGTFERKLRSAARLVSAETLNLGALVIEPHRSPA